MISRSQFLQGIVALFVAPKVVAAKPKVVTGWDFSSSYDRTAYAEYHYNNRKWFISKDNRQIVIDRKYEHIKAIEKMIYG